MYIFYQDFRVGHREIVVGEVPEALDAQSDQPPADLLCSGSGQTEHRHLGMMLLTLGVQLIYVQNGYAADGVADFVCRSVKGGDQFVAVGIGGNKTAHSFAQPSAADQDGGQALAIAKNCLLYTSDAADE